MGFCGLPPFRDETAEGWGTQLLLTFQPGRALHSAFEFIPGFGEAVEAAPDQPVHGDHHERDEDGGQKDDGETSAVSGGADLGAEADGLQGAVLQVRIFRVDRSIPCAAGGGDHAGNEVREDSGENELCPTLPAGEVVEGRHFPQVGGDGHGSGDDVEKDVPLCAEEHQRDGADAESPADANQADEDDGKKSSGRDGSKHLGGGLNDAREPRIETDGDADGNRPGGGDEQGGVEAKEGGGCAFKQQFHILPVDSPEHDDGLHGAPADNSDGRSRQKPECGSGPGGFLFVYGAYNATLLGAGKAAEDGFFDACPAEAGQGTDQAGAAQESEDGRSDAVGGLHLLELELVAPGNQWPPDQLIGGDDNE